MTMKPPAPEKLPNGTVVAFDPLVRKYAIVDGAGVEHGYRRSLDAARAFALTLPYGHCEPPMPAPISVSPRAHPEVKARLGITYEPAGPQPDEQPMPAKRAPEVIHSKDFVRSRMHVPGGR